MVLVLLLLPLDPPSAADIIMAEAIIATINIGRSDRQGRSHHLSTPSRPRQRPRCTIATGNKMIIVTSSMLPARVFIPLHSISFLRCGMLSRI